MFIEDREDEHIEQDLDLEIMFHSGLSDMANMYFTVSNATYCGTFICSLPLLTGLVQLQ
jgi:hypothetical protein